MSKKHTPGPWKWMGSKGQPNERIYLSTPDGYASWTGRTPEETANAQLIASAPELLEALDGLESAFDKWYCNSGHLCALLDGIKKEDATPAMMDEVVRLQNLIVMSIKARTVLKNVGTKATEAI